jgi:hypothetical protein
MSSNLHRNSTEANKHTPKGFDLAVNNSRLVRDERGQSRYIDNLLNERAENLVDGNSAPPTTTEGHVYVLIDEGSGSVHVDWQGANYNDIVRVQGGVWGVITPVSGYLILNKTDNKYYKFNGSIWEEFIPESENIYTNNGTTGSNRTVTITDVLNFNGGKVALNSTANGFLINRVTTLQMNSIATPSTNELVFNTDLNGLYRYDGSSWVALSSGYGIIGVYSGSGNGTPTFFADLQSALETCKASGGYFTVKLFSNITITSSIEIDYTGSGTGNAYLFRQLSIDFNGFSVTNAQANTSNAFTIELSNSASVYQEIKFINGAVLRTNGTGTHHAFKCDTINRFGIVQMVNMLWYCQNNQTARINLGLSTAVDAKTTMDLGGSVFVSGGTGRTCTFNNSAQTITNFSVRSTSSLDAFYPDGGRYYNFYAENTSSGAGILAVGSNTIIANFNCRSNSGKALDLNGTTMEAHNFTSKSTSGISVDVKGGATATLFKCDTGNAVALNIEGNSTVKHAYAQNNSGSVGAVATNDANIVENVTGVNLGASFGGRLQNTTSLRGVYNYCTFKSIGGIGAEIISTTNTIDLDSCNFESQLDTSGGHACRVQSISAGAFLMTKCDFKVRNSGANALNASGATTVRSRYCTHNDVASTPINANVTIVSSGIIS